MPTLWSGLLMLEYTLRLALALHVIMRRRPVPVTLAWIALLVSLPLVGLGLYFLVGETRLGAYRARRHDEMAREIEERAVGLWRARFSEWTAQELATSHLAALGTRVGGMPPLKGNQLEIIGGTDEFLHRLATDIHNAHDHCHLLYYIWTTDEPAARVSEALIRAAQRGVRCRVLVDGVGSREFLGSALCAKMRSSGVAVVEALPVRFWRLLLARVDLRNHRKIAVIDGVTAYAGSHNLTASTYPDTLLRRGGEWIDSTLRIKGPAVQALQTVFLSDWYAESEEKMTDIERLLEPRLETAGAGCVVHVIPSGPGPEPEAIHQSLVTLLHNAREEIIMTTPYFVPDEATKAALCIAAHKGVEVTLVLPERSDMLLVGGAARSHYEDLLLAGVKILHFTPGVLHAKTITVDRKLAVMTSVNFDARSFFLNFECSLFIYDDDFASELRFMQKGYMTEAKEIHLDEWRKRSFLSRLWQNVAQLAGPLL